MAVKVVISVGGRFHSIPLASALIKKNYLHRLYTIPYWTQDKEVIPRDFVRNEKFLNFFDRIITRFPSIVFNRLNYWNLAKDNLFDYWVKNKIRQLGDFDIFVGWNNYILRSLPEVRKRCKLVFLEVGSPHIKYQNRILSEEFEFFGVPYSPNYFKTIDKSNREYGLVDYIFVPSDFVVNSFVKEGISREKLIKAPYGADLKVFNPVLREGGKSIFRVIFVGMLNIGKGIYYLLKAWKELNLPAKDTELLLVGYRTPEFSYVLKKVGTLPVNVKFMNIASKENMARVMANSTVLVQPSLIEGLSMVQAEALASGIPIICTTNTGGSELIKDGEHGFIIPIRDIERLKEKISWCYEHKVACEEMGKQGRLIIQNRSWDKYGEEIVKLYEFLLKSVS